ncbi:hypothetical protein [Gottfriedia acidiceleris]|uniref:hypothetical protein n=1 Tax=Gottfriedia acidiceleris TaxID=371036 RepID=UPI000B43FA4F|nr:hypothetical protein [Gottfriedia acidiceleris]
MSLLKYHSHDDLDLDYWQELGIAINPIVELSKNEGLINQRLSSLLNRLTIECLKELATLYNLEIYSESTKEKIIDSFIGLILDKKKEIIILQDFLNRKKRTIDELYLLKMNSEEIHYSTSLPRLIQMFKLSPKLLMEGLTYFLWNEKGSGKIFSINKVIPIKNLLKLISEYKQTFPDRLYQLSGKDNNYKIHSFFVNKTEIILSIYKQVNDSTKQDFDKAIRNKEVSTILLSINSEQEIVEVKGANNSDAAHIITYIEETFPVKVSKIETGVFKNYDPVLISNAFLSGEPIIKSKVKDFLVTKISFRTSLLKKSPKMTYELENESIWPSVIDANDKGILSFRSIKDIEHIMAQVQNKKRLIRSIVLSNGNVVFSMDDSKMDKAIKQSFIEQFEGLFGIPLFHEISNYEFFEGKADKLDYIMALSTSATLTEVERTLFDKLVASKLIKENNKLILTCTACGDVSETEDMSFDLETFHCSCENTSSYSKKISSCEVDIKKVTSKTKQILTPSLLKMGYVASPKPSTIKIDEEKYQFINFHNDDTNETIQLFITSEHIRSSFMKRITTMMIPTIIVTVGMVEEAVQSLKDQGVYPISFSKIYLSEEEELEKLIHNNIEIIKMQSQTIISKAADHATESLERTKSKPSEIVEGYDDKIFEDDVFAILKDLVPNGEKWGKEKSGKPFPEGIFAISTKNTKREDLRRVFSYDCKFTKKDIGYDLAKAEQRKAIDYVEKLNDNPFILRFSDKEELSAHLFISNRFQDHQKDGMREYFNEKLGEKYDTHPVFLDIQSLLYLHKCYRKNVEHIDANRNLFYERLIHLFTRENITQQEIDKMFRTVLDRELVEHRNLDTKKVTDSLEEGI